MKFLIIFFLTLFLSLNSSFADEKITNDECLINEKQDQITFANLKFGENINQVYCRLTKILDKEKYLISLFGYETNGYFPEEGLGNTIIEHNIKNDKSSKLISELIYHNFCSLKKEDIQYYGKGNYHNKLLNLSNTKNSQQGGFSNTLLSDKTISTVTPYSLIIHPVTLFGSDFNLQLIFDLDAGKTINDDFSFNEKLLSQNICKEPYDGSGFEKVYFPYSLAEIMLYTDQNLDQTINRKVFDKILSNLKNKYSFVKNGSTKGYYFLSGTGCEERHIASDGKSMIQICFADFSNKLSINYAFNNNFWRDQDKKVLDFLDYSSNENLNKDGDENLL